MRFRELETSVPPVPATPAVATRRTVAPRRAGDMVRAMQRSQGNQAVQALGRASATGDDRLGGRAAAPEVQAVLRRRGGGAALPASVAARLGAGFGADLSGLRVHTGAAAGGASRGVGGAGLAG